MRINVIAKKEILYKAEEHQSVWPHVSYANSTGLNMIAAMGFSRFGPVKNSGFDKKHYYNESIQEFLSVDNGKTWTFSKILFDERNGFTGTKTMTLPHYFIDKKRNRLVSLYSTAHLNCDQGQDAWYGATNMRQRTFRIYYRISSDGGKNWAVNKQVIHKGPQFNAANWLPGVKYGYNGAATGMMRIAQTDSGTIVVPIIKFMTFDNERDITLCDHQNSKVVAFLLGKWNEDASDISWKLSEYLDVPADERPSGISEPDIVSLGGERLFATFRAIGTEKLNIPSVRMCASSEDGGKTWSKIKTLKYDDGLTVWVPACPSEFIKFPNDERIFWIANYQGKATFNAYPRNPLGIGIFDVMRKNILKDSVTIFWRSPDGFNHFDRRYSNFNSYVDRQTNEIVINMPEEWKFSRADYTADAISIRLKVDEEKTYEDKNI